MDEIFSYTSQVISQSADVNEQGYVLIANPIKSLFLFKLNKEEKKIIPIAKSMICGQIMESKFFGKNILMGDD